MVCNVISTKIQLVNIKRPCKYNIYFQILILDNITHILQILLKIIIMYQPMFYEYFFSMRMDLNRMKIWLGSLKTK